MKSNFGSRTIAAGRLAFVFIFVICIGLSACSGSKTAPAQAPAQSNQETPSATTVTNTKAPITAEESSYATKMADNAQQMSSSFAALESLLKNPQPDDADWKSKMTARLAEFQSTIKQGQAISAPASMSNINAKHQEAFAHYYKFTELLGAWVQSPASTNIDTASTECNLGNECAGQALSMLKEFIDQHPAN